MITFLHGTLVEKQPTRIVLDVGGVGYEVFIPLSSYDGLPEAGKTCRLLIEDHVREDAHLLYGFLKEAERQVFYLVTAVSGIGPKIGLSVLSRLSVRELKLAVVEGDVKRLSSVPGIGKKTAERMIVELRHKLSQADVLEAEAGDEGVTPEGATLRDSALALIALGYTQDEARKMIKAIFSNAAEAAGLTVEDVVKRALGSR